MVLKNMPSDSEIEQDILAFLAVESEPVPTWTAINSLAKSRGPCHWSETYKRRAEYSKGVTRLRRAGKIIRDKSQSKDTIELNEDAFITQ